MTYPTPYTCPDCGSPLQLDTAAETESPVYVQRRGEMPRIERRRRPCLAAFCSGCVSVRGHGAARMTDAATLVRRITAAKYPNGGRYLFEPYELQQFIEAVQRDARASAPTGDDDMATFLLRRIDDDLWQRFLALAAAERVTPKELLLRVITAYVNGAQAPLTS